ncbi:MAG: N-acetylmuramoyl-L-alanine amidase [Muribaculaceae bacterium]|nr:N-acetylmuramoyl-L-alanine amidase [Muribaculaceae bacterium]
MSIGLKSFIILSAASFFICPDSANALEIVYPKSDEVSITSGATFFIGNENPDFGLKINSESVKLHENGSFLHPVKLNSGENVFILDNGVEPPLEYRITRVEDTTGDRAEKEVLYDKTSQFITAKNGVVLYSTPYTQGINRLQLIEKDIPLSVVGEFDEFYKVQLARDDYVWVLKDDVAEFVQSVGLIASVEGFEYCETRTKRVFTLKLSDKVPYILSETGGLDLVVYNLKGYPEGKYEFHINNIGRLFGYKVYYKNNNELVVEVKNPPVINKEAPLKGLKITLDPGHGGSEEGAIGCLGDKEKDINLAIALKLKDLLIASGAEVFMTRDNDSSVFLAERVNISRENDSDVFISIHNNALPDDLAFSGKSGSSVFYYYPQSKLLGNKILKSLVSTGMRDDKLTRKSFAVIRNTESLAVLVEVGYMIQPEDNAKLVDDGFQQMAAEAIKQGMENYFNEL